MPTEAIKHEVAKTRVFTPVNIDACLAYAVMSSTAMLTRIAAKGKRLYLGEKDSINLRLRQPSRQVLR
jgi:hypothetical protein